MGRIGLSGRTVTLWADLASAKVVPDNDVVKTTVSRLTTISTGWSSDAHDPVGRLQRYPDSIPPRSRAGNSQWILRDTEMVWGYQ